jgi:hypothetical protein
MGYKRRANGFWWKILRDKDQLEDLGIYGTLTLKLILRLTQIIRTTPGQQIGKN